MTARQVPLFESHVPSFLKIVLLTALLLVVSRHWPPFLALFGSGTESARFDIHLRPASLPEGNIAAVLMAILQLEVQPYRKEY